MILDHARNGASESSGASSIATAVNGATESNSKGKPVEHPTRKQKTEHEFNSQAPLRVSSTNIQVVPPPITETSIRSYPPLSLTNNTSSSHKRKERALRDNRSESSGSSHDVKKRRVHLEAEPTRDSSGVIVENTHTLAPVIRKDMETTAVGSSPKGAVLAGQCRTDSERISGAGSGSSRRRRGDIPHVPPGSADELTCKLLVASVSVRLCPDISAVEMAVAASVPKISPAIPVLPTPNKPSAECPPSEPSLQMQMDRLGIRMSNLENFFLKSRTMTSELADCFYNLMTSMDEHVRTEEEAISLSFAKEAGLACSHVPAGTDA